MRRIAIALAVALAACGDEGPQRGVDTTLPGEPATLAGTLTPPGEYMPSDMQVCAETLDGRTAYCKAEIETSLFTGSYTLKVPDGSYRVFARTAEVPNYKAYYSECTSETCTSHKPIVVTLAEGDNTTGINPGDWFNRPRTTAVVDNDEELSTDLVDEQGNPIPADGSGEPTKEELDRAFPPGGPPPQQPTRNDDSDD